MCFYKKNVLKYYNFRTFALENILMNITMSKNKNKKEY